jgi:hypothetical protein
MLVVLALALVEIKRHFGQVVRHLDFPITVLIQRHDL